MASNDIYGKDTFTLSELLGGSVTLVIPDMQRDYCWGNEPDTPVRRKSKISLFVSALAHVFSSGTPTPLGLLYGYEEAAGSSRIFIIDGQQRITTLYLLVGMLYRRTPTDKLRQLLISDYELIDDQEPRLLYQMRSEALYFMSDLVTKFFLDRNGRLSQLEHSDWYYTSYDSDRTVQSFIKAIRLIDEVMEEASTLPGWDFAEFADFVTDKLSFMYHPLGSRKEADDMFITINTTGEPLTFAQSIKARLAGNTADTDTVITRWEEMEQWAWTHRDRRDASRGQTSDALMDRILHLWVAYNDGNTQQALEPECFDGLYRFFTAYSRLVDIVPQALTLPMDKPETQFLTLPTLVYISRWDFLLSPGQRSDRAIREFWAWLTNIIRYIKVTASGSDTQAAIKIANKMSRPDITAIIEVRGVSDKLINKEERAKLTLLAKSGKMRREANALIQRAEEHPLLYGRTHKLINWSTDKEGMVDIDRLAGYVDMIYALWGKDIDRNPGLDDLRRALLTLRHPDYPIVRRGETCLSLCWHDYDWQRLMTNAPGLIRLLIDRYSQSQMPARDFLQRLSDRFNDRSYPYYFLIKSPGLLSRCHRRMLLRPCMPFLGLYLSSDDSVSLEMRWCVEQHQLKVDTAAWSTVRTYGARCLYTDHRSVNVSLDLYYRPDEYMPYRLEIFARDDSSRPAAEGIDFAALLQSHGYQPHYDKKRRRHYTLLSDARAAVKALHALSLAI